MTYRQNNLIPALNSFIEIIEDLAAETPNQTELYSQIAETNAETAEVEQEITSKLEEVLGYRRTLAET